MRTLTTKRVGGNSEDSFSVFPLLRIQAMSESLWASFPTHIPTCGAICKARLHPQSPRHFTRQPRAPVSQTLWASYLRHVTALVDKQQATTPNSTSHTAETHLRTRTWRRAHSRLQDFADWILLQGRSSCRASGFGFLLNSLYSWVCAYLWPMALCVVIFLHPTRFQILTALTL